MNCRSLQLILMFSSIWAITAVSASAKMISLADALRIAERENIHLRAVRQEADSSHGKVTSAMAQAFPQLTLTARYYHVDDVAAMGETELGQMDNYEAKVDVSQLIYSGGALSASIRMAESFETAASARIELAIQKTYYAVHLLFSNILLAEENLKVAKQAVALAKRNLKDTTSLLAQKMARRLDLMRAKEQISRTESDYVTSENALIKARLNLAQLLNLPLDQELQLQGSLTYSPVLEEGEHIEVRAIRQRPELAEAEQNLAMRKEAVTIARSNLRPSVSAFGDATYSNPDRAFEDDWERSWTVGLRAEMRIFDGFETKGKVTHERARLRQSQLVRDDLISKIKLETAQAMADVITAARLIKARETNVTQAGEALRLVQISYAEGLDRQIDVISAQQRFTQSQREYAAALYQHSMARCGLQLATGDLKQETIKEFE